MSSKARQETGAWERVNHHILLKHRDVLGAMGDETPQRLASGEHTVAWP